MVPVVLDIFMSSVSIFRIDVSVVVRAYDLAVYQIDRTLLVRFTTSLFNLAVGN